MATKKNTAKKKATTRKRKTSTKTKPMEVADGKNTDLKKARDLEELLSVKEKNAFATADGEDFEESLSSMNLTDMQELAVRAGIFPSGTKTTLKNKILKEFKARSLGQYRKGQVSKPSLDPKSKQAKDLLKLLNE